MGTRPPRIPTVERFWSHVHKSGPDDCWEWTAKRQKDGYACFWDGRYYPGTTKAVGMMLAHRWAYEHFVGEIPEGNNVCHRCDNPPCVNPAHLFVATQRENVHDCIGKGRHRNGRVVLSQEQEDEVREKYRGEYGDLVKLADMFGVSKKLITGIVRGLPRKPSCVGGKGGRRPQTREATR